MKYELLIRRGRLVDPSQGIDGLRDVAFARGRVAAVEKGIPESLAAEVLDASGLVVTPGLVDIHVHAFWGVSHYGIDLDPVCLARGVTTAVDAGSSGAATFPGLRRYVLSKTRTRMRAFLNISAAGMIAERIGELEDLRWADVSWAVERAREHADLILGIKVRLSPYVVGKTRDLDALARALEAAQALGKPLMVHVGDTESSLEEIMARLRPGDIVTHAFHGWRHGVLDDAGRVLPGVREAVGRGVMLDIGHGRGSFSFHVAEAALSQGLKPGSISTDVHIYNYQGPVHDMATNISKFLKLGLPLAECIELATVKPSRAVGLEEGAGSLTPGAPGDAALFRLEEGRFTFVDSYGNTATGAQRLVPVATVQRGKVYRPRRQSEAVPSGKGRRD